MNMFFPGSEYLSRNITGFKKYLSRLVNLDRLHQATRKEEEDYVKSNGGDPFMICKPPSANRGGVAEKFIKVLEYLW